MALTLEWRHRIEAWRQELPRHFYRRLGTIQFRAAWTAEQLSLSESRALDYGFVPPGRPWGKKWEYGWFKGRLTLPEASAGERIVLRLDVGAEAAVFIDGVPRGAVDQYHTYVSLTDNGAVGSTFEIALEAYAGHGRRVAEAGPTPPDRETVPEPPPTQCVVGESGFGIWQEAAYQLWVDVETLWEVREALDPDSLFVMAIDEGLRDFTRMVDFELPDDQMLASLKACRQRLQPLLQRHNPLSAPEMVGFGHSHIDVAWLWPLAETQRKCLRTFSTQLSLMDRYPDYRYLQSQPHLYWMVQRHYPELFERIKAAVARGQWIPEGAAWVEPDTNITGGESLIRQLVHGKRYFRETFGVASELLWLPDVFGYSGALPQIMLGCGVTYFSTQKIFWAYHGGEPFPYNTFLWEGIDGSVVKAHFHTDYNSETRPSKVMDRWKNRVQKDGFTSRLFPFGWGDGGGGPTRDHLEFAARLKDMEGVPRFRIDDPMAFFKAQDDQGWPDERYVGELYFQNHRGTYTSQARTKALNRRCEFALRRAELWGAAAVALSGFNFPTQAWESAWRTVLLNQFHDILPGSSIHRVYEEAEAQLGEVQAAADRITQSACESLVADDEKGVTVFNALSWGRKVLIPLPEDINGLKTREGHAVPVQIDGGARMAEVRVPPCGWVSLAASEPASLAENTLRAATNLLENEVVRVIFDAFGEITSIFDKVNQRELAAGVCNHFAMYRDVPSMFDAWDIDSMYQETPVALSDEAEICVLAEGPLFARLRIRRRLNHSLMTQIITLQHGERRLVFQTEIDWQERHKLLKVNFPVAYHAHEALHEIQFGHLARPTHTSRQLDKDRFEVACQKWSALVEGNRGFALLNDSKYGVNVKDNSINLTLLKSALAPDMTADRGLQAFTYAAYFWDMPFVQSGLVQKGYELNEPVLVQPGQAGVRSLFSLDDPNIVLDTVKPAEDGSGDVILRLYDSMRTTTRVTLTTTLPIRDVFQTDMLENVQSRLAFEDGRCVLDFRPFQIMTLRLKLA